MVVREITLTHEKNAANDYVYREVTAQDALGNITAATLNGNLSGTYGYDHVTGQMLYSQATDPGNNVLHNVSYYQTGGTQEGYDSYGNLTAQELRIGQSSQYSREVYHYDALHRLTQSSVTYTLDDDTTTTGIHYAYDVVGNIKKKTDYSANDNDAYQYSNGTSQIDNILLDDDVSRVYFGYDNRGNQVSRGTAAGTLHNDVTYNAFNKPTLITKNGANIALSYGADIMRYKQSRIVREEGQPDKTVTTWYIGKHFEVEENPATGTTTHRHFISDVAIVNLYDNQAPDIVFTHRDRLGSVITMTNEHNHPEIRRFFDPFGKPRNGGDWSLWRDMGLPPILMNLPGQEKGSLKGFTDHEHLDDAELIHMNGRVYDYNVGRFMSVDPIVHEGSQGINPYSYIMNNPLSGTDPTGYKAEKEATVVRQTSTSKRVSVTGSRIKGTETTTTSTMSDGSIKVDVTLTSNGATLKQSSTTFTPESTTNIGGQTQTNISQGLSNAVNGPSDFDNAVSDFFVDSSAEEILADGESSLTRDLLSFVPVLGSALDAYDAFNKGNIGMGLLNVGLALTDLTGAGAIVKGLTVGTLKYSARKEIREIYKNSKNWSQMRTQLQKADLIPKNSMDTPRRDWLTTDHIFIKQKSGKHHRLLNHPANLQINVRLGLNSSFEHMGALERAAHLPTWMKLGGAGSISWGIGLGVGSE